MLLELLSDLIKIDDILLIIKNNGATSEIRSNSLSIKTDRAWRDLNARADTRKIDSSSAG